MHILPAVPPESASTPEVRPRDAWTRQRLAEPSRWPLRVVIDTDAANEIDDPFALAWALLRPDRLHIEAIYAAPYSFAHRRATYPQADADAAPFAPPGVGMQRSLEEIEAVLACLGLSGRVPALAGSNDYLQAPQQPQYSAAAAHLIELARRMPAQEPLYVLALGCVTNIASALLLAPDLVERIVVVWTSGYPSHAPHVNDSFNLEQDLWASQHLMHCGVPLVYLPGFHVGAQLRLSRAEADAQLRGGGAMAEHLYRLFTHNPLWALSPVDTTRPHSWVIWDLICVAWVLNPHWVPSELVRTPRLGNDLRWQAAPPHSPLMREAHGVARDAIFGDLLRVLDR